MHQDKVDPEGAEPKKKAKVKKAKVTEARVHCEACNASFKRIQELKRHEQTMKHQHKVNPEGKLAAAEKKVADKIANAATPEAKAAAEKKAADKIAAEPKKKAKVTEARVHCEACNASFKRIQELKRHEQTMKHQHKVNPCRSREEGNEVKLTRTSRRR